jgi:6-pyruvoyltetrahydropterin/6-carboxytetrahydropterin synthase
MEIRKKFSFCNKHIVRNCSSERCKFSEHSHEYFVEVILHSNGVDNGQMVLDFGLFKNAISVFIKSFDNTYSLWDKDDPEFKDYVIKGNKRVIELPKSPSAEMLSSMFFFAIDKIIKNTEFNNGEQNPSLVSVRVHETITGWAETNINDLSIVDTLHLDDFKFSDAIINSWKNENFWNDLKGGKKFINPSPVCQVKV